MESIYLTKQEIIYINKQVVKMVNGVNYGVQSDSALDAVIEQPKQIVFGRELYPTIWLKAAYMLQKITKKHVFVDGNKRTAIQAAMFFLYSNGYKAISIKEINNSEEFILSVTNSPDTEETMLLIAEWLENSFVLQK